MSLNDLRRNHAKGIGLEDIIKERNVNSLEDLVRSWLSLEEYPEVVAAEEVDYIEYLAEEFDNSNFTTIENHNDCVVECTESIKDSITQKIYQNISSAENMSHDIED